MVAESASSALLRVIAPGRRRPAKSSIARSLDLTVDRDRHIAVFWHRVDIVRLYDGAIVVQVIANRRRHPISDTRFIIRPYKPKGIRSESNTAGGSECLERSHQQVFL